MSLKYSAEARLRDALLNAGVANPEPLIDGFREEIRSDYALTTKNIKAEAWDEGVMAVRDWWETPDDEKYVIFNPYGIHPADRLLDDINGSGDTK